MKDILKAWFQRLWYLLVEGMWNGECAITVYDHKGVSLIASGSGNFPAWTNYRVWWQRPFVSRMRVGRITTQSEVFSERQD